MKRNLKISFATFCLSVLVLSTTTTAQEKWSRQIEQGAEARQGEALDWIPLAQPLQADDSGKERAGRILTYSPAFPQKSNLLSPANQPFDFPFHFPKYESVPQTQPLRQTPVKTQEPTSQSFFKFEMPYHGNNAQNNLPTVQTGYQIQHSFGAQGASSSSVFNSPLFNQQPLFPPEFHPLPPKPLQQRLQQKPLPQQNFIDDFFPLKTKETKPHPTQQSLQNVSPQVFPVDPQPESVFDFNKPSTFQLQNAASPHPIPQTQTASPQTNVDNNNGQQEVQLLYVPYETLYNQQQQQQQQQHHRQHQPQSQAQTPSPVQNVLPSNSQYEVNKFNLNPGLPPVNPYQVNQFYNQDPLAPAYYTTSTTIRPITTIATSLKPNIFQNFVSQLTTPKPKPKAHQPPLAMFVLRSSSRTSHSSVVNALMNAATIAVIDSPTPQTPEIFVGPAGMPIPNGYVKFDLPYLSQLSQTNDLNEVPFFVAPLSYRTPNGFSKILLPEPHVGSIVVNRAKGYEQPTQPNEIFNHYELTTPRTRINQQRQKPQQQQHQQLQHHQQQQQQQQHHKQQQHHLQQQQQQQHHKQQQQQQINDYFNEQFDITTQRATLSPTRGNKFSYYFANEAIQEVSSPKTTKPKKKRPQQQHHQQQQHQPQQTVQIEEDPSLRPALNNLYAQFNQIPNQVTNEEFFKVQPHTKASPTSTSTSSTSTTTTSTSTTTSTTPIPLFTFSTSPQIQFHSTSGQLYPELNQDLFEPEHLPRFTTKSPTTTTPEEEYRMKQYFRQQDAFRNRPHQAQPTNAPYEQNDYTPVALDFERAPHPTNLPKQRVPTFTSEASPLENEDKQIPANHKPAYQQQNEIQDATLEYEPNPYQLPSELPALSPNLPGLVNNLQEKEKQNIIEQTMTTTQPSETEAPSRAPSRRPLLRTRKPVVSKVSSQVSYSESESTSRRPAQRIRRPFGTRANYNSAASQASADTENETTSTTRRPASVRNPLIRNPNRIRYQPTNEERQSLRIKSKKHYSGSKKNEHEDLEYQRDVLKQNYPVITPGRKATSPTAIPSSYAHITTTESPASESQQVYTVTPSNHIDDQRFPESFLEHMNIAPQYSDYNKENYGPGYFPNQEDLNPTEPVLRNEIYTSPEPITTTTTPAPAPPTTTTTTTEEPETSTTRRAPFLRRNYPRLRTTTEIPQTTTTEANEEKPSTRPRVPPRKVIRVRTRTRRPLHPASTTNLPEDENPEPERRNNYRKYSRPNQDLSENDVTRRRYKQQYQLDGQESQWSAPKLSDSSNFKPVNPKETRNLNSHRFEDEPEIVTADPQNQAKQADTYEFKVGANYGPSVKEPNLKPEKSFAELLEEVMGKAPQETTTEPPKTTDGTFFESQKTTISQRLKERRGKWRKQQQRQESFETAESQSLGSQLVNSLYSQEKTSDDSGKPIKASLVYTTSIPSTTTESPFTTTSWPLSNFEVTTSKQNDQTTISATLPMDLEITSTEFPSTTTNMPNMEFATRRMDTREDAPLDDLESQPSLFSEVKRQLHELFSIEENDEQAVTAALAAVGRRRQQYTDIKRTKPETTTTSSLLDSPTTDASSSSNDKTNFHRNLMRHVVYATSQPAKEETPDAEICYRGRCIKSEDLPPNHKLH